jgi:hypothetical protein
MLRSAFALSCGLTLLSSVSAAPLPTQLVCAPNDTLRLRVSREAAGAPREVGVGVTAGTRECDFTSRGAPAALPGGGWRFEWDDAVLGQRQRVDLRRDGAGYALAFEPAACGVLQLPATATLTPARRGCRVSVDRDAAFADFWRALRDAIAREDGAALQRLALPQLEFVEGPDIVRAPAAVLRGAARCLPDVPATTQRLSLRDMLAVPEPRLDMPPLSRKGESRIDFAGAMSLRWTREGWRIDGFNASRSVFEQCGRP